MYGKNDFEKKREQGLPGLLHSLYNTGAGAEWLMGKLKMMNTRTQQSNTNLRDTIAEGGEVSLS